MAKIFLTHTPDMLANYYGPRALAELRKLGEVRLNETADVLDAAALAQAARGCEIVVSDRQTPGPAGFFQQAADCVAFLRVAIDIRNIDVEAASREGILVTQATAGFIPAVAEMAIGMMVDLGRHITRSTIEYRGGKERRAAHGQAAQRRHARHSRLRADRRLSRASWRRARHAGAGARSVQARR